MNKKTLEMIKKDLLRRQAQIKRELAAFTVKDKHEKDTYKTAFPNYGDQTDENAQEVSQYITDLEVERVLKNTLEDINNTLKSIEKGTYGICKYCGQEIEEKRLLVRPFSSACVKCKSKLQKNA